MMRLEAVNSSSRIATASGGFIGTALSAVTSGRAASTMPPQATSMVLIASSEGAKTDRARLVVYLVCAAPSTDQCFQSGKTSPKGASRPARVNAEIDTSLRFFATMRRTS